MGHTGETYLYPLVAVFASLGERVLQHGDDGRERGCVPDLAERIEGVPHHEPALVAEPRQ